MTAVERVRVDSESNLCDIWCVFHCWRGCENEFAIFHQGQENRAHWVLRPCPSEDGQKKIADDLGPFRLGAEWRDSGRRGFADFTGDGLARTGGQRR